MDTIIGEVSRNFDYFILLFIRITSLLVASPIFGVKSFPSYFKVGFCLILTYVLFAADPQSPTLVNLNLVQFAVLGIKELLLGLALGYVTTLFFTLVQTAGAIIDMQIGFGMVNVLDMQNNVSVPISGNFLYMILIVAFFGVNGHLQLINILSLTVQSIPIGTVSLHSSLAMTALSVFSEAFILAVNVAMPLIVSGLLSELIMGFVVRTVPQMNMFVVGIPLKIILGLLMLLLVMPVYVAFTGVIFNQMFSAINQMMLGLAGS